LFINARIPSYDLKYTLTSLSSKVDLDYTRAEACVTKKYPYRDHRRRDINAGTTLFTAADEERIVEIG